ncbi:CBS domain-containing protein [Besnoitia besnoiti]|uniref:CBS domain-containing protein n=1 Tax=Besnoitia besnoiti TaxID=94643 RepID=A0A2A9M7F1_BESBE|nr:CBS domain-containing protein [Besnoitia besnoiti]PFH31577.1 CBS domain-containing protein [Besnoitia besnoiti]
MGSRRRRLKPEKISSPPFSAASRTCQLRVHIGLPHSRLPPTETFARLFRRCLSPLSLVSAFACSPSSSSNGTLALPVAAAWGPGARACGRLWKPMRRVRGVSLVSVFTLVFLFVLSLGVSPVLVCLKNPGSAGAPGAIPSLYRAVSPSYGIRALGAAAVGATEPPRAAPAEARHAERGEEGPGRVDSVRESTLRVADGLRQEDSAASRRRLGKPLGEASRRNAPAEKEGTEKDGEGQGLELFSVLASSLVPRKSRAQPGDLVAPASAKEIDSGASDPDLWSGHSKGEGTPRAPSGSSEPKASSSTSTSKRATKADPVQGASREDAHGEPKLSSFWRTVYTSISVGLVAIAGLASGLTTGYMSFDELQLLVIQETGPPQERKQAEAVCSIVRGNRHQLLVTLLLCNSLAMEALPLFLDRLLTPLLAVVISVTAILFVGEILPQALCTGKYQLPIAAAMAPAVRLLIFLFAPLAYPISKLLDRFLTSENRTNLYARSHLKALIGLHEKDRRRPFLLQHAIEQQQGRCVAVGASAERPRSTPAASDDRAAPPRQSTAPEEPGADRGRHGNSRLGDAAGDNACAESSPLSSRQGGGDRERDSAEAGGENEQRLSGLRGERKLDPQSALRGSGADAGEGLERQDGAEEAAGAAHRASRNVSLPDAAIHRSTPGDALQSASRGEGGLGDTEGKRWRAREEMEDAVGLDRDEVLIMQGALDMACKSICDFMVPLHDVFMLECSMRLTRDLLVDILRKGHSRIPVYEARRSNVRGVLLVKSLILIDPNAGVRIRDLMRGRAFRRLCTPLFIAPSVNPYQVLNEFQEGRCHLAFVTHDVAAYQQAWEQNVDVPATADLLGIVTLEDVIEELIQEEIMDEFDKRVEGMVPSTAHGLASASSCHSRARGITPVRSRYHGMDTSELLLLGQPRAEAAGGRPLGGLRSVSHRDPLLFSTQSPGSMSRFASLLAAEEAASAQSPVSASFGALPHLGSRAALLLTPGDRAAAAAADEGQDGVARLDTRGSARTPCDLFPGAGAEAAAATIGLTALAAHAGSTRETASRPLSSMPSLGSGLDTEPLRTLSDTSSLALKQEMYRPSPCTAASPEAPAALSSSAETSAAGTLLSPGENPLSPGRLASAEVASTPAGRQCAPESQQPCYAPNRRTKRRRPTWIASGSATHSSSGRPVAGEQEALTGSGAEGSSF